MTCQGLAFFDDFHSSGMKKSPCFCASPSQPRPLLPVAQRPMGLVKKCSLINALRLLSKRVVKVSGKATDTYEKSEKSRGYHARTSAVSCSGESPRLPRPFPRSPTSVSHIHDRRVLPSNRCHHGTVEDFYRRLHTCDLDPEAHDDFLLARMSRDLQVMYEPPDLSTPEAGRTPLS